VAGTAGLDAFRDPGSSLPALGPRLAAVFALLGLLGCASESPRPERTVLLGSPEQTYLILPLNLAAPMPSEVEPFSAVVWQELEQYLRAHDKQLKTVDPDTAKRLWVKSVQKVKVGEKGSRAGFADAAALLAVELHKSAEFGAMIAPSIFIREAEISQRSARWDGVERAVEIDESSARDPRVAETPFEGVAPAASIHIAVFDARGAKLHEGKGGLELVVRVRLTGEDSAGLPTFKFTPRSPLFENREQVIEGITVAFAPFLAPLPTKKKD
jgi:hypothetical protein